MNSLNDHLVAPSIIAVWKVQGFFTSISSSGLGVFSAVQSQRIKKVALCGLLLLSVLILNSHKILG